MLATLVAAPGLGIVYAQRLAVAGYVALGDVGIGSQHLYAGICSQPRSFRHGADKLRSAVGVDGVVAAVIGHHHIFQPVRLSHTCRYREHDAIAEGHNGRFHILFIIVALGDGLGALQERTLEILVHKSQIDYDMLDAQALAVHGGKGNLTRIVIAAIIKRDTQRYTLLVFIEHGDAVHASTYYQNRIFVHIAYCYHPAKLDNKWLIPSFCSRLFLVSSSRSLLFCPIRIKLLRCNDFIIKKSTNFAYR